MRSHWDVVGSLGPVNSTSAADEWVITDAGYRAAISSIGATVRELTYSAASLPPRDLIVPFPADTVRPLYRGALIAPWPNRIQDGRYTLDGRSYQLPINEVDRQHALHGLVQWARWTPVEIGPTRVVLQHRLVPQDGYPFPLLHRVEYRVSDQGLETTLSTTNTGKESAPYGCCPHPYLVAGAGQVDDWMLQMPASTRLEVDGRLIPVGAAAVDTVGSDFRVARRIGTQEIDHAFTGLRPIENRFALRVMTGDAATGVEMTWGAWGQWLQIHTADRPEPEYNRVGLAAEPMSCAPNAFNDPAGPPVIEPGATHHAEWTIRAVTVQ